MRVGVPKETKNNENRVGLTPNGAAALVRGGHRVRVQAGAGEGAGFGDSAYAAAGAELVDAASSWDADLVIKVKEPLAPEYAYLRGQIVFTYFHLAGVAPELTAALLDSGTTAVAYEAVEDVHGRLPLLAPMSAVAGSMAPIVGAYYLAKSSGGLGTLPGEILGTRFGKVLIGGDGVVGRNAARVAAAMGTRVVMLSLHPDRARDIERIHPGIELDLSTPATVASHLTDADLFIGATLIRGARALHLVTEEMVQRMQPGAVIVDVSIDQGGCVATSRPTSHADPVFVAHGVTHYCVPNMPGAYPRTSTLALTTATLPYVVRIAAGGVAAILDDPEFARGVNTYRGFLTCRPAADALGLASRYRDVRSVP